MEKGFLRQSILIEDLEAYAGFFNSEWADREIKRARSTPFGEPLFHLLYAWRGASYVRQMPLMANNAVASSVDVALRAFPEHFVKLLATLKDRIVLTTSQEPLTQSQIRLIEKDLHALRGQLVSTLAPMKSFFNAKDLWKRIISTPDMQLSLCKSEESAYLSVYYGYEVFLTRCVGLLRSDNDYAWYRASTFEKDIEKSLGAPVCGFCWRDDTITKARLVRNGILHHGSKMTIELERFRNQLHIHKGMFSIAADETTGLANALTITVTRLMDVLLERHANVPTT